MLIDINVEVFQLALFCLDGINEHWLENVARPAPGGTRLDQDGSFAVLKSILPVSGRLHLFDVAWLAGHRGVLRGVGRARTTRLFGTCTLGESTARHVVHAGTRAHGVESKAHGHAHCWVLGQERGAALQSEGFVEGELALGGGGAQGSLHYSFHHHACVV